MIRRRASVRRAALLACALAAAATFFGCAGTSGPSARRLLADGDYAQAARLLADEERERPENARIKRDLGIALLGLGQNEEAAKKLEDARALEPRDSATLLNLGRAYESLGRLDEALAAYGAYPAARGRDAAALRLRIETLSRKKIEAEIRAALAAEKNLDRSSLPENTVAVLDFTPLGGDSTLAPLGKGLASMLITDLRSVSGLRVVERAKIRVLLDEISMAKPAGRRTAPPPSGFGPVTTIRGQQERLAALKQKSDPSRPYYAGALDGLAGPQYAEAVRLFQRDYGLTADGVAGERTQTALDGAAAALEPETFEEAPAVEAGTAPRVGALVGARRLVQGGFTPLADEAVRVDAALTDVASSANSGSADASGKLDRFFEVEKDLLVKILETMNVSLTPKERRDLLQEVPTRDFLAFLSYSRGLDYEDRGDSERALGAYREALRHDSGFAAARERADVLSVAPAEFDRLVQVTLRQAFREAAARTRETLNATGGTLGQQMEEGQTQDESEQSQLEPQAATPTNGTVIVTGTVPKAGPPAPGGLR